MTPSIADRISHAGEKGVSMAVENAGSPLTCHDTVASRTVGDAKQRQLNQYAVNPQDSGPLTTYWGTQMDKTDVSIRAGERGPTIMNDFHAREKIQKFDHERIPERIGMSRRKRDFTWEFIFFSVSQSTLEVPLLMVPSSFTPPSRS